MAAGPQLAEAVRAHVATRAPAAFTRTALLLDISEPRRRTGQLHASKQIRSRLTPTGFAIDVAYSAPQAAFTNDGTRPHVIRARRKKALYWPGARHPVVSVRHPGTRATKWFTKATSAGQWLAILRDVFG